MWTEPIADRGPPYPEVAGVPYPIAVHDQWESAELYDQLSR